jgi:hypothetical protein
LQIVYPRSIIGVCVYPIYCIQRCGGGGFYGRQINGPLHALTAVDLACRVALTSQGVVMLTLSTDIQRKSMSEDKPLRLVS